MKIIRPEYTPPPKEKKMLLADGRTIKIPEEFLIDDNTYKTEIEKLMDEVIDENFIKIEITLTKEEHEAWINKGAKRWLKEELTKKS